MTFTKKQLYAYSVMNWKLYRTKLYKADKRYCSFCRDCISTCKDCQIARYICDMRAGHQITTYTEIITIKSMLFDKIDKIISELINEYNNIKEADT